MKRKMIAVVSILILTATTISYGSGLTATLATYDINLNNQRLEATPLNVNGSTYLPVRTVSEALGVDIGWTGSSVEINTVDIEALKEACVMINAESATKGSQGSAVCWDYGEYLTVNHAVTDGKTNIRSSDNSSFKVGMTNAQLDIATLTTDNNVKPVKIGDSDEVKPGDKVIVISSPNRELNKVVYASVEEPTSNGMVIWGDLDVGSSGGAVFTLSGELVGIVVSGSGFDKAYLAVPINDIREAF
jgi:S1-C subfamily serine protease